MPFEFELFFNFEGNTDKSQNFLTKKIKNLRETYHQGYKILFRRCECDGRKEK
jgi:hypothetical protein